MFEVGAAPFDPQTPLHFRLLVFRDQLDALGPLEALGHDSGAKLLPFSSDPHFPGTPVGPQEALLLLEGSRVQISAALSLLLPALRASHPFHSTCPPTGFATAAAAAAPIPAAAPLNGL